jgi:hypothetical protein
MHAYPEELIRKKSASANASSKAINKGRSNKA